MTVGADRVVLKCAREELLCGGVFCLTAYAYGSGFDLHQIDRGLRSIGIPSLRLCRVRAKAIHHLTDTDRTSDEMVDLQRTRNLDRSDPVQGAADRTTALRAIRRATKNARFHAASQIGRIIGRHLGEKAIFRT